MGKGDALISKIQIIRNTVASYEPGDVMTALELQDLLHDLLEHLSPQKGLERLASLVKHLIPVSRGLTNPASEQEGMIILNELTMVSPPVKTILKKK